MISAARATRCWRSVFAADGDVIVWCDADIRNFGARFVIGLVGPLLTRTDVGFVKGYYDRPLDGRDGEGGRVTELVARPLVSLLFPHLSTIIQPLGGRVRRATARSSSSCPSRRATASTSRCSSTSAPGSGWSRSPRSTSALGSTATARSTSCRLSRWRSCRRSWPASGVTLPHGPARPLVRPGSEPVLVDDHGSAAAHRARRLPPTHRLTAAVRCRRGPARAAEAAAAREAALPVVAGHRRCPRGARRAVGVQIVTGSLFTGVKLALIGVVVYAAVRLAMGPRDRR